jgi:hypothetical protein
MSHPLENGPGKLLMQAFEDTQAVNWATGSEMALIDPYP